MLPNTFTCIMVWYSKSHRIGMFEDNLHLYTVTEDWIANIPKMAADVGDKFEFENFRMTVANKSEVEVCLYFFPIDKHV